MDPCCTVGTRGGKSQQVVSRKRRRTPRRAPAGRRSESAEGVGRPDSASAASGGLPKSCALPRPMATALAGSLGRLRGRRRDWGEVRFNAHLLDELAA